jgi:hypothetical protein
MIHIRCMESKPSDVPLMLSEYLELKYFCKATLAIYILLLHFSIDICIIVR